MIKLLLSDVDGTLVTKEKVLTPRSVEAVQKLHDAGIHFAVTSGRPPRGMAMLVEPLALSSPLAGFNGGLVVEPNLEVVAERTIPERPGGADDRAPRLVRPLRLGLPRHRLAGSRPRRAARGARVAHRAVRADRRRAASTEPAAVAKIVGVSDDYDAVAAAETLAHERLGEHVAASRSQPYYLDVTHPQANKGAVVTFLSERYDISTDEIATIGDMPNDVLMFAHSGLSIAMGNAHREVQRAARQVTTTNDEDGFAHAVERFILDERS